MTVDCRDGDENRGLPVVQVLGPAGCCYFKGVVAWSSWCLSGALLASYWWFLRSDPVLHFVANVAALPLPLDLHAAVGQAKMPCQTFRYPFGGGTSPR